MAIINRLADLLIERKSDILAANQKDLRLGHKNGRTILQEHLLSLKGIALKNQISLCLFM